MPTLETSVVNEMALQNFSEVTSTTGSLPDYRNVCLAIAVGSHKVLVLTYTKEAMITTASFTIPLRKERSPLESIIDDLDRLDLRSNPAFQPSSHARRSARFYILEIYAKMGNRFPRPSFVLDGEKGIIIKWVNNGYTVRLNCLASPADGDYIYFENGEYDIEEDVTIETLHNRLKWLIQHGRR